MTITNEATWGMRDLNAEHRWKRLNLNEYSPNKPIVVCLGGNGTVTESSANGLCKLVENYLQLLFKEKDNNQVFDNVDIISAVYPKGENPNNGEFSQEDINNFVDNVLLKLIQDENDELLPLNEACRRLSQVTFFTFCLGHLEADKIMKTFYNELRLLGLSSQECNILMLSTFEISFAPLIYSSIIPVLFIDSKHDELLNSEWKNNEANNLAENLEGVAVLHEKYGDQLLSGVASSEAIFDAIHIYVSKLSENFKGDEHNLLLLFRDSQWNAKYEGFADCVSQMIAWILCRSVENGIDNKKSKKFIPKKTLEELIQELESIKNDFVSEQLMSKE